MENEIQLGDEVRDIYTGFKGVAIARTEFINGCVQYSVVTKVTKNEFDPDKNEVAIDSQSLELVKSRKNRRPKQDTGGAYNHAKGMRGY